MKWILIVIISFDAMTAMVPCSTNTTPEIYTPQLEDKQVVYTFDSKEELEEYLQWSVDTPFCFPITGRSPAKRVISLYYGKEIKVSPVFEEIKIETCGNKLKKWEIEK